MMYLGAAMSVTAFPVLARIIQERGIGGTALGTLALAAGAVNDMIAWLCSASCWPASIATSTSCDSSASHAVFVAFVVGALMPRGRLTETLSRSHRAGRVGSAGAAVFCVFGLVDTAHAAVVGRAVVAVGRRHSGRIGWKGRRMLGRGAAGRPPEPRSAWRLAR